MTTLNQMDVKQLINEPSVGVRSMLAGKIATSYLQGTFTGKESDLAVDIFRILLKDIDKKVRLTMAEHLRECPHVPHDIIFKLANDEADVASHVLEHSSVLTEEDLIAIAENTAEVMKLCAIARRDQVPERLSEALMNSGIESVLKDLFCNKGAALSEHGIEHSWDFIATRDSLLETLVDRGGLPLTVAEKLFYAVSDELRMQLSRYYKIDMLTAQEAAREAREWQMLGIVPTDMEYNPENDDQVEQLIEHLYKDNRLTHSMIIRALCMGNLVFFESGLAKLAGVPRVNAHILLMDEGELGMHAIYKAAAMPSGFFEAVRILLRLSMEETLYGHRPVRRMDLRQRMIERIYKDGLQHTVENMQYVLSIIGGKLATADA